MFFYICWQQCRDVGRVTKSVVKTLHDGFFDSSGLLCLYFLFISKGAKTNGHSICFRQANNMPFHKLRHWKNLTGIQNCFMNYNLI